MEGGKLRPGWEKGIQRRIAQDQAAASQSESSFGTVEKFEKSRELTDFLYERRMLIEEMKEMRTKDGLPPV